MRCHLPADHQSSMAVRARLRRVFRVVVWQARLGNLFAPFVLPDSTRIDLDAES